MRSRAARLTLSATAWLALGAAGYFLLTFERSIALREADRDGFDARVRQAGAALADVRIGQEAYVAAGQDAAAWMPKVEPLINQASSTLDVLRQSAVSEPARQALGDAAAAITELGNVDKRVRDYLAAGDQLMASDVVFGEGDGAAARAAARIESARQSEYIAFTTYERRVRQLEATLAGGAAGMAALVLVILAFTGDTARETFGETERIRVATDPEPQEFVRVIPLPSITPPAGMVPRTDAGLVALRSAAELCTALGQVRDQGELQALLQRAAAMLDAAGLVVWLGDAAGSDLLPVMAQGYSAQVLSMMRPVARTADNAAAAAYRSGRFQVVPAGAGGGLGAIAAPLVAADGCFGALTAEIRNGLEASDQVEALATILAAQLAGALAQPASDASATPRQARASA